MLDNISFDFGDVEKILFSQGHSAPGTDGIPGVFFKRLASVLALPMCILFHQSLYQCAIPDMWRAANITPLYKGKENRQASDSYQPISLTNLASKILERLICNQIKTFWLTNNIICDEQHDFRLCRSTTTNLVQYRATI